MPETNEHLETTSDEKAVELYEEEFQEIERMFPNAKFVISIGLEELDTVITAQTNIVIKQSYTCYCYEDCKKKPDFFYICGENMTNKFIIQELIEQGLEIECNHCFLEGFDKTENSECQFELGTGS
jgi:Na+-transporting NADH:ubiquinone oxidoreductase subunit NqrF